MNEGAESQNRQQQSRMIAEMATQDVYKTLILGVAVVSGEFAHAQNMLDEVVRFMEEHAESELTGVERE